MFLDPKDLQNDPQVVEDIEESSVRCVTQALELLKSGAVQIFQEANDRQADIGEDITGEPLNSLGMSSRSRWK